MATIEGLDALLGNWDKQCDNWQARCASAMEQIVSIRRRRFGTQRITHELRQKGISDDLISTVVLDLKQGELESAREVWQKKFDAPPQEQKEKARQIRFLQSRGFSMEVIFKVLKMTDEYES